MMLVIRPIRPADSPAWIRMRSDLWPGDDHSAETTAYFEGRAAEPQAVLVALVEDDIVGVCELSIRTDVPGAEGKRTGFVEGLYVDPSHRHQRVAQALLQAAQSWARLRNCEAFGSDRDDRFILDPKFGRLAEPRTI